MTDVSRRDAALLAVVVFLASLAAFLVDIGAPAKIYFDETWYVPAARQWLATGEMLHPEHPPLAKLLISASVALFGDTPSGWRIASAVFGALTMAGVFLWTLALADSLKAALWAAATTLLDQILFVQARIAMLDVFLFAFVVAALAAFSYALKARHRGRAIGAAIGSGVAFGLAGACKLSGFFALPGLVALSIILVAIRHRNGGRLDCAPGTQHVLTPAVAYLAFILAPALAYLACFVPGAIHAGTILYLFRAQHEMLHIMLGHSPTHPYMSEWPTWPIEWRPVWYLFDVAGGSDKWDEDNPAQAVFAIANPLLLIAGELAILWAVWRALVKSDLAAAIVAVAFFAQWAPWIANPKGLEFFYYFFPSILCLGPALALAFYRGGDARREVAGSVLLILIAATFVFFLPTLEASFTVTPEELDARTWLSSWR
jgi:dolichyl-phosphate-mannose--protein O-mannosyl transferase